jgi:ribosomal-protein-alanine N-acetyltransferase
VGEPGMSMLELRPMMVEDLDAVVELEGATYTTPWSERVFRDELQEPSRRYVVASDGESVVGYAGLLTVGEEGHVTTVAVSDGLRSAQLGTRLMLYLVDAALQQEVRHLTLEVRFSNTAAQALYRKFGLAPIGVRKNYYGDEDALIMWAHDIDSPEYADRIGAIRSSLEP